MLKTVTLVIVPSEQGLTGSVFFTSGRDGSGTCKKVQAPGQVGTGSEKIFNAKMTYHFPHAHHQHDHIHLLWNFHMKKEIDDKNSPQIVTILSMKTKTIEIESFLFRKKHEISYHIIICE